MSTVYTGQEVTIKNLKKGEEFVTEAEVLLVRDDGKIQVSFPYSDKFSDNDEVVVVLPDTTEVNARVRVLVTLNDPKEYRVHVRNWGHA